MVNINIDNLPITIYPKHNIGINEAIFEKYIDGEINMTTAELLLKYILIEKTLNIYIPFYLYYYINKRVYFYIIN